MRTLALLLTIFYATNCMSQKAATAAATDEPIIAYNHKPDTAAQHHLNWLLELPPALTVVSCGFLLNSSGELFKASWSVNEPGKWGTIQALMNRAKAKDKLIFTDIYVMKGDKKLRLADKTIELK